MLLMQTTVLVGADRNVVVHLPHSLPPGRHRLTVVIDDPAFVAGPEVADAIGGDYDGAQAAAYDAVYHHN